LHGESNCARGPAVPQYPKIGYYYAVSSRCRDVIDVTCPMCGEVYHAEPVHAGKHIQCRRCGSLVPILAAGGTIVQQTPGTREVVQPSPPVTQPRSVPPSRRRKFLIFGSAVAVAVIAGGLVSLLWYSNTDTHDDPISGKGKAESHDSAQAGAGTQEPVATPDRFEVIDKEPQGTGANGLPCDEQESRKRRSLPNGSRIMPDPPTTGYVQRAEHLIHSFPTDLCDCLKSAAQVACAGHVQTHFPKGTT
jgi:hypothetical protein